MSSDPSAMPARPARSAGADVRRRALIHGLTAAGLLFLAYLFIVVAPHTGTFGFDAFAYWSVQLPHPYGVPVGGLGSFLYSPAIALLFSVFAALPLWVYLWLWLAAMVGTIIWLGGRWALLILAFPPVALELYHGNIHLFMAAAIAIGFAHPSSWAFILLTKATSGVGLLWFVVRREWRQLFTALGVAATIAAVSFVFAPALWSEWLHFVLQESQGTPNGTLLPVPLWLRLPVAAAVVIWGARTDRRWTVAVAATIALPVLWITGFAVLAGGVPELRARASRSRANAPAPSLPAATAAPVVKAGHVAG